MILFSLICANLFFLAFCILLSTSAIYAAGFLILLYINGSLLLFLLGADFLGLIVWLVYVGAIMILFLFMFMMLNLQTPKQVFNSTLLKSFNNAKFYFVTLLFIFSFLYLTISRNLEIDFFYQNNSSSLLFSNYLKEKTSMTAWVVSDIEEISSLIYNSGFSLFVLFLGFLFFVVVVAAIVLTFNFKFKRKK